MQVQPDAESLEPGRADRKPRLELVWVGKDARRRLEPRILIEHPDLSGGGPGAGISDNRLVFGDNLLALKALEQEFAGRVRCCFIDPPYNTGSAFAQYEDGVEHSLWLGLMRDRLEIIRRLLRHDGSLWISIDDNEAHYLKVLCDEIFGRRNFVTNVVWQKRTSPTRGCLSAAPTITYWSMQRTGIRCPSTGCRSTARARMPRAIPTAIRAARGPLPISPRRAGGPTRCTRSSRRPE